MTFKDPDIGAFRARLKKPASGSNEPHKIVKCGGWFSHLRWMRNPELYKLRQKRQRIHRQLDNCSLGCRLPRHAPGHGSSHSRARPRVALQLRRRPPNPVFERGELTRFALDILRGAIGADRAGQAGRDGASRERKKARGAALFAIYDCWQSVIYAISNGGHRRSTQSFPKQNLAVPTTLLAVFNRRLCGFGEWEGEP